MNNGSLTPLEAFIIDQKIDDATTSSDGSVPNGALTGSIQAGQGIDHYVSGDFPTFYRCVWYTGGYNINYTKSSCNINYFLK